MNLPFSPLAPTAPTLPRNPIAPVSPNYYKLQTNQLKVKTHKRVLAQKRIRK